MRTRQTRRRLAGAALAAAVMGSLVACRSAPPSEPAPRAVDPELVHLLQYEWLGSSPGAGFYSTEVRAVEIDFIGARRRSLYQSARAPDPMLDSPGEEPPPLLASARWVPLTPDQLEEITFAALAWLDTSPSPTSDQLRSFGREDAYIMRFTLRTADRTYRVRVNPPRGEVVQADRSGMSGSFNRLQLMISGRRAID